MKQISMLLWLLLGMGGTIKAQHSLEYETHGVRLNDQIQKTSIEYFSAGDSGEGVLWDFRDVIPTGDTFNVAFCCDSDSVLISLDPATLCRYEQTEDTLKLLGYETPMKDIVYEEPIPLMVYPFFRGNEIQCDYIGHGTYCKTLLMDNQGTWSIEADAEGSILVSDGDTVRNVLRLHVTKTNAISMYTLSDTLDVGGDQESTKQEIEECYLWYARGYRYPLYETSTLTCYDNLTPVSCTQIAYRCLPQEQVLLNDPINEEIQLRDSLERAEEINIFPHEVSFNGNTLILNYDLLADANINALICNAQGMVYAQQSTHAPSGENYQMAFDCSTLRRGEYVLYINVNGKVYNEKFQIK